MSMKKKLRKALAFLTAAAMQAQYGGFDYFITDANVMEAVDAMWSPSSSCYGPKEVWAGAATSPDALVADTLEDAIRGAYAVAAQVQFENAYCRKDIGQRALRAGKGV